MRRKAMGVAMALSCATGWALGCGSESAPADAPNADSGAGASGTGNAGSGASAGTGGGGNAGTGGGVPQDARNDDAASEDAGDPGQCGACPPGTMGLRDRGCVDGQSGAREKCDADSIAVDFGERCYPSCRGVTTAPTPDPACPPCAPLCTMVGVGLFCDGQLSMCAPPGYLGPGCEYP